MERYIPLDDLVVEIKRHIELYDPIVGYEEGRKDEAKSILSFIDTLEVKEVDLKEEMSNYLGDDWEKDAEGKIENEMVAFAKHFFELGLRASNPLTWEDIACIEDITSTILTECKDKILYDTQESICKEILKRFKAQKGK